jgi:hypothetical protein
MSRKADPKYERFAHSVHKVCFALVSKENLYADPACTIKILGSASFTLYIFVPHFCQKRQVNYNQASWVVVYNLRFSDPAAAIDS